MIGPTKACIIAFMKARNSLVFSCINTSILSRGTKNRRYSQEEQKTEDSENVFF